eukprot:scaffold1042_cov401-Prasinococcus_capsulatus_cf.AAC.50
MILVTKLPSRYDGGHLPAVVSHWMTMMDQAPRETAGSSLCIWRSEKLPAHALLHDCEQDAVPLFRRSRQAEVQAVAEALCDVLLCCARVGVWAVFDDRPSWHVMQPVRSGQVIPRLDLCHKLSYDLALPYLEFALREEPLRDVLCGEAVLVAVFVIW